MNQIFMFFWSVFCVRACTCSYVITPQIHQKYQIRPATMVSLFSFATVLLWECYSSPLVDSVQVLPALCLVMCVECEWVDVCGWKPGTEAELYRISCKVSFAMQEEVGLTERIKEVKINNVVIMKIEFVISQSVTMWKSCVCFMTTKNEHAIIDKEPLFPVA